jgi:hypothetical protein
MKHTQCSAQVNGQGNWGSFHQHQCSRKATIERDGVWYCRVHDPEYIKRKNEIATEKFHEEQKRKRIEYAAPELLEACKEADHAIRKMRSSNIGEHSQGVDILYEIVQGKLQQVICKAEGKSNE